VVNPRSFFHILHVGTSVHPAFYTGPLRGRYFFGPLGGLMDC